MSAIDVLLQYASKAAALADPALAPFIRGGNLDRSRVFDNLGSGLQVWNSAQDTTATETLDGQSVTVTTHQFQGGYALMLTYADATIAPGQAEPAAASLAPWKANAACLLIADFDRWQAVKTPGDQSFLYYVASAIAAGLSAWMVAPLPFNRGYPFGNP